MGNTVKVAVSMHGDLLAQVDRFANRMGKTRSALVRDVLQEFIAVREEREALDKARRIYAEIEDADRELSEEFLRISARPNEELA